MSQAGDARQLQLGSSTGWLVRHSKRAGEGNGIERNWMWTTPNRPVDNRGSSWEGTLHRQQESAAVEGVQDHGPRR